MSDLKISALPQAVTPLAGTEILPVVQNATTKKISVADLTLNRNISTLSTTAGGDGTDGSFYLKRGSDGLTVNTITVNSSLSEIDFITAYQYISFNNYNGAQLLIGAGGPDNIGVLKGNIILATPGKGVQLTSPNGLVTKTLSIDNAGLISLI